MIVYATTPSRCFNHDGVSDVAIQQASDGRVYYSGGALNGWGLVSGAVGTDWKAVGTGDITGDGFTDVVFQSQSSKPDATAAVREAFDHIDRQIAHVVGRRTNHKRHERD